MSTDGIIHNALASIIDCVGNGSWIVGGSAGLLLRGLPLEAEPRDLDLYCDEEDAAALHRALRPYATDAPSFSETDIYRSTLSHFECGGMRVELVAGFQVRAYGCLYAVEVKELLLPHAATVDIGAGRQGARQAQLVPLAHELWFNALRGRSDRVRLIAAAISGDLPRHAAALEELERRNALSQAAVRQVRQWINDRKAGEQEWTLKLSSGLQASQSG